MSRIGSTVGKKEVSRIKKCLLSYWRSQDFEDRTVSFNFVKEEKEVKH